MSLRVENAGSLARPIIWPVSQAGVWSSSRPNPWAPGRVIDLAADEVRILKIRAGQAVHALAGALWLTRRGPEDVILEPGQHVVFQRTAHVVLGGLRNAPARLRLADCGGGVAIRFTSAPALRSV